MTQLNISNCSLRVPGLDLVPSFIEALREGHRFRSLSPEATPEEIDAVENDPAGFLRDLLHPPPTITWENGETVPRVPCTEFWFCNDLEFVGAIHVRHYLTAHLEQFGGHIGYIMRPKYRGRGLATEMLRQILVYCREHLKLDRALLTCNALNTASARVIEKNGGQLQDIIPNVFRPDRCEKRYWINLASKDA